MNRRGFLGTMIGGVVAAAAVRTWPFRVYSFPSEPVNAWWNVVPIPDEAFKPTAWLEYLTFNAKLYANNPRYSDALRDIAIPSEEEIFMCSTQQPWFINRKIRHAHKD